MLRLQDVSLMRGVRVLYSHATLLANPGERIGLVGENGCGKSSLLAAILGEVPLEAGEISAPALENIGHVAQDIDTVDEVAIDWVLSGHAPLMAAKKALAEAKDDMSVASAHATLAELNEGAITAQAKIILHGLGFTEEMTTHHVKDFSGGWRNRLALARALMCPAELLLLDEPTANLDPDGVKEVHDAVRHVLEQTHETLVVVEHHIDVWLDLVDRVIVLGKPEADSNAGGVIADGTPDEVFGHMGQVLADGGAWVPGRTIESHAPKPEQIRQPQDVVLYTRDLSFGYDFPLGEHIDLEFHSGEVTALTGRNGVGKSTLGLTLAGLLKPIAGRVCIADDLVPPHRENNVITWKSRDLLGRIGMVFQEPEHQFAASTVRDEVAIGPKSMGKTDEEAYSIADRLLERLNLSRFAKANPFTLSGGEKRRLSVASMLAAAPKVLVMDEPTFGQDFTTWTSMVQLIAGARDQGCAVIMITHDEPLIEALGARRILVREGE